MLLPVCQGQARLLRKTLSKLFATPLSATKIPNQASTKKLKVKGIKLIMDKQPLTPKDLELIDEAYSTTYKSTVRRLIREAETDRCRQILTDYLQECPE